MATYEALEMAGVVPNRTPSTQQDRVGVFMGVTSDDWREVNNSQNIDTYFIPGGIRAFIPGRIRYVCYYPFDGRSNLTQVQLFLPILWSKYKCGHGLLI